MDITNKQPVLITRPGPQESNLRGDMFGGALAAQIDIAASITAGEVARGMVVTRAIKDLEFIQPIFTYDVVSFYTEVARVGTTSITINVEVYARRTNGLANPEMKSLIKVSSATLIFVAVNKPGEKREIPK